MQHLYAPVKLNKQNKPVLERVSSVSSQNFLLRKCSYHHVNNFSATQCAAGSCAEQAMLGYVNPLCQQGNRRHFCRHTAVCMNVSDRLNALLWNYSKYSKWHETSSFKYISERTNEAQSWPVRPQNYCLQMQSYTQSSIKLNKQRYLSCCTNIYNWSWRPEEFTHTGKWSECTF